MVYFPLLFNRIPVIGRKISCVLRSFSLAVLLLSGSMLATSVQAMDLIQAYEWAKSNDPKWAAARSVYQADQQSRAGGRGLLLPEVRGRYQRADISYRSDQGQIRTTGQGGQGAADCFNDFGGNFQQILGCVIVDFAGIEVTDRIDENYLQSEISLDARGPLFDLSKWYEYRKWQAYADKAEAVLRKEELEMLVRVAEAYFDVLRAQDDLEYARLEETATRQQVAVTSKRFEQGIDMETDLYQVQASLDALQAELVRSYASVQQKLRVLAGVTGVYEENLARISEDLPIERPVPESGEEWMEQALAHNSELDAKRYAAIEAHEEYRMRRARHLPVVNYFVRYQKSEDDGGQGFVPGSEVTAVGVEVQIPLFVPTLSPERKRALYRHQAAKDELTATRWLMEGKTLDLHMRVNTHVQRYQSHLKEIASSNNAYRAIRKSYREGGNLTVADVLEAQKRLYQSRRRLTNSRYDYIIDTLRLKKEAGVLSVDDLVALNRWMETN